MKNVRSHRVRRGETEGEEERETERNEIGDYALERERLYYLTTQKGGETFFNGFFVIVAESPNGAENSFFC